jgi:hypothetical protein
MLFDAIGRCAGLMFRVQAYGDSRVGLCESFDVRRMGSRREDEMTERLHENRRRFERYAMRDSVFLAFRPRFDRLGLLVDISRGGVAFEYTASDKPREEPRPPHIEVEIFSHDTFRLSRIPCTIVYDTMAESSLGTPGFETRRCGLQFARLSDAQMSQLKILMETHAGQHVPAM